MTHIKVDKTPQSQGFGEEFSENCLHFHVRDFQQTPAGTERLGADAALVSATSVFSSLFLIFTNGNWWEDIAVHILAISH